MIRSNENYAPKARREALVIEGLGHETLVYDMRTHKAHCLNRTAALVWSHCDGKATPGEMRAALEAELGAPVGSDFVWLALNQLHKARLLSEPLPGDALQQAMSRRTLIRKLGLGAVIALPLVTSILAPTSAEAVTCSATGGTCSSPTQCCPPAHGGICACSGGRCVGDCG